MTELELPFVTIRYKAPVVYLVFKEGADLDVPEVKQMIKVAGSLTNNNPYLLCSDARTYFQITSEARKVSSDKSESSLVVANAVLVNNLPLRLTANLFIKINKPHFPLRVFTDEEKAMEWLLSHKCEGPKTTQWVSTL